MHLWDKEEIADEDFEDRLRTALYLSYLEARKGGKRKTRNEHAFEVNAFQNLKLLRQDIMDRTYRPSRSVAHIIFDPVIREIFAATFRDRIVHHLIFAIVYDWWDKHFIYDSYSCRTGKGVKFGLERLDHHIRSASLNYARKVYVLKLDIQGYFMSLPRARLYEQAIWGLERQFQGRPNSPEYQLIKFLWYQTIFDDPVEGVRRVGDLRNWDLLPKTKSLFGQPRGKGIVIGNLTSQLLSNIYLNQLDLFITKTLGYKHYGRYVDDFYIVVTEERLPQLKCDVEAIENYLKSIELTLHPKKRKLQEASKGVDFIGGVVYPDRVVPGRRLAKNFCVAMREVEEGQRSIDTVASYLGHLKYFDSNKSIERAFGKVGWDYKI